MGERNVPRQGHPVNFDLLRGLHTHVVCIPTAQERGVQAFQGHGGRICILDTWSTNLVVGRSGIADTKHTSTHAQEDTLAHTCSHTLSKNNYTYSQNAKSKSRTNLHYIPPKHGIPVPSSLPVHPSCDSQNTSRRFAVGASNACRVGENPTYTVPG